MPDCEMNIRKLPSGVTTLLASWETMGPRTAAFRVDRSEFPFSHAGLGPTHKEWCISCSNAAATPSLDHTETRGMTAPRAPLLMRDPGAFSRYS